MDFNQNTPLVFNWKNEDLDKVLKFAPLVGVVLLGIIPLILWLSFPSGFFSQIDWGEIGRKMLQKPDFLLAIFLYPVVGIATHFMMSKHRKNARLTLGDNTLNYSSGLPLLSRWFDWQLDLEDVRSGKLKLNLNGRKYGKHPLALYRFSWGVSGLRQFRPAAWVLPNQTALPFKEPTSFMGYVSWKKPENAALLEEQFSQLPLIKALTQRGVNVPKIANTTEATGLDLMAHPRMKVAVISFFVALVGAFVLFHLMRHQHYFSAPPISYQLIAGAFAGLLMFAWLWGEKPDAGNTAEQAGFRGTQVLLACLFAVSAGLCAPSVPLLFASILQTSQEQSFELQKSPLLLKSSLPTNMPAIQPTQALDYWQSLKDGEVINLPVSRGFAGLWWQYDSSVLQDKVEAFYSSQPMSTINKRR
jgi:hypothetical protein